MFSNDNKKNKIRKIKEKKKGNRRKENHNQKKKGKRRKRGAKRYLKFFNEVFLFCGFGLFLVVKD